MAACLLMRRIRGAGDERCILVPARFLGPLAADPGHVDAAATLLRHRDRQPRRSGAAPPSATRQLQPPSPVVTGDDNAPFLLDEGVAVDRWRRHGSLQFGVGSQPGSSFVGAPPVRLSGAGSQSLTRLSLRARAVCRHHQRLASAELWVGTHEHGCRPAQPSCARPIRGIPPSCAGGHRLGCSQPDVRVRLATAGHCWPLRPSEHRLVFALIFWGEPRYRYVSEVMFCFAAAVTVCELQRRLLAGLGRPDERTLSSSSAESR